MRASPGPGGLPTVLGGIPEAQALAVLSGSEVWQRADQVKRLSQKQLDHPNRKVDIFFLKIKERFEVGNMKQHWHKGPH